MQTCHTAERVGGRKGRAEEWEEEIAVREKVLASLTVILSSQQDSVDLLVLLVMALKEPNIALLERVVHTVDEDLCKHVLEETKSVEEKGGMLTAENVRKTTGGVFLSLLKQRISPSIVKFIWDDQLRAQKQWKRNRNREFLTARKYESKGIRVSDQVCKNHGQRPLSTLEAECHQSSVNKQRYIRREDTRKQEVVSHRGAARQSTTCRKYGSKGIRVSEQVCNNRGKRPLLSTVDEEWHRSSVNKQRCTRREETRKQEVVSHRGAASQSTTCGSLEVAEAKGPSVEMSGVSPLEDGEVLS
eukprot:GHVS01005135.1.p1 GENE.GHVS01005135.1~~GHVS01005135.1.p1  ORF type:complete len:301 (-),score=40.65 GHVS01005135.1:12-914(-)